jgi:hypothetical protein
MAAPNALYYRVTCQKLNDHCKGVGYIYGILMVDNSAVIGRPKESFSFAWPSNVDEKILGCNFFSECENFAQAKFFTHDDFPRGSGPVGWDDIWLKKSPRHFRVCLPDDLVDAVRNYSERDLEKIWAAMDELYDQTIDWYGNSDLILRV